VLQPSFIRSPSNHLNFTGIKKICFWHQSESLASCQDEKSNLSLRTSPTGEWEEQLHCGQNSTGFAIMAPRDHACKGQSGKMALTSGWSPARQQNRRFLMT
jgi:hypothetical protein